MKVGDTVMTPEGPGEVVEIESIDGHVYAVAVAVSETAPREAAPWFRRDQLNEMEQHS